MNNYCAFSKKHKCLKWMDYELTRMELKEADSLCHENWIEIQRLYKRNAPKIFCVFLSSFAILPLKLPCLD